MVWVDVNERLPKYNAVIRVRTSKSEEKKSLFYTDKMLWIAFYGKKPSYFWDYYSHEPLHNVTHWKEKEIKSDDRSHQD